jgi:hypothetical protein
MNRVQDTINAVWTAAMIAAFAYIMRKQIERELVNVRAAMDARRAEIEAAKTRMEVRRGWIAYLRDHGMEPDAFELGMEP